MGKKQEMDEDMFDQMVEALHPPTVQEPPIQTSTRWQPDGTYDKKPNDPKYFLKILSKEIINPFHLPRLRTHHFVQIQFIQTSSDQHLYEETDANVERCFKTPYGTFHSKGFLIQNFLNNNHFY